MHTVRWVVAAALLLASLVGPRALSAQEQGVFELRLTALPETRTVVVTVDPRGEVLIPLQAVVEHLGIPMREAGDTLVLDWPPEIWRTELLRSRRFVRAGADTFTVAGADWQEIEGEPHLAPRALARVLQAEVNLDWENLGIVITGNARFPVITRARNEAGRIGRLIPRRADEAAREAAVPYQARTGGTAVAWDVAAAMDGDGADLNARVAGGFAVAGGALEAGTGFRSEAGQAGLASPFARYVRGFPRSSRLRRLQVGSVYSEGLTARPILGFTVSNAPLYAPAVFGEALLRPVVPAGWEFEVYQGDQLVGVSTAGSNEAVPASLSYGATPVRVRMLGPAGEERVQEITFLVAATQVPPGEWRYHAGAGACQTRDCDRYAYGDLRRGLSARVTLGAGADWAAHGDTSAVLPYGLLVLNPGSGLQLEGRVQPRSLLYGSIHRYTRYGGVHLVGGARRQHGVVSESYMRWFTEAGISMRGFLPGRGQLLSLSARAEGDTSGAVDQWRTALTTGLGRATVTGTYESGLQRESLFSLYTHFFVPRHLARGLRDLNLNARVDLGATGVRGVVGGFTLRPRERANLTVLGGWNRDTGTPELSVGLITRLPGAYVQSNAFAQGARRGAFVSAGGGVAMGGDRVIADPFQMLGRAGITGRAFLDENGNGVYDSGEPTARGVPVAVGMGRAFTDSAGRYTVWGLFPYAVLEAGIDTLNLATTDLAAAGGVRLVRLTPNMFTLVDLPLVRTREVTGRIAWRAGRGPVAGVTVEFRREGSSGEPRRVVTFSDGEYYLPQLPPGRYLIGIAASSLQALRARLDPGPAILDISSTGPQAVQAPPLWLTR